MAELRGQRSRESRSLTGHHFSRPPATILLPSALLDPNSVPSPHPRHPITGKGSFPASAARLPYPRRGYLLQKQDKGQGARGGEATRRSEGRRPGEKGGRRQRRLSARVLLLTALPLLCAEATSPAGRRHPPRRRGGGEPPSPGRRAPTFTCLREETPPSQGHCRSGGTGEVGRGERGEEPTDGGIWKSVVLPSAWVFPPHAL